MNAKKVHMCQLVCVRMYVSVFSAVHCQAAAEDPGSRWAWKENMKEDEKDKGKEKDKHTWGRQPNLTGRKWGDLRTCRKCQWHTYAKKMCVNPSCRDNPQKWQMDHIQGMLEQWIQSQQHEGQAEEQVVDVEDADHPAKKFKQGQATDIEGFK